MTCLPASNMTVKLYLFVLLVLVTFIETGAVVDTNVLVSTTKKPNVGNDESTITSIERPPFHRTGGNGTDESGVTLPPQKPTKLSAIRQFFKKINFKRLQKWKKLFSRVKHVHELLAKRKSEDVGQARVMESWMEGAMVPMTFLLMAAFIMDILQRLFPLPYAAFVQQQWAGSEQYVSYARATTTRAPDLTKFAIKSPFGSFGIETNDKKKTALFGRSNLGNPPVVPTTDSGGNNGGLDTYVLNLFNNNNTGTVQSSPIIDYDSIPYSSPYGPLDGPIPHGLVEDLGPHGPYHGPPGGVIVPTADGVYELGDWPAYGEGWSDLPVELPSGYGTTGSPEISGGGYGQANNNATTGGGGGNDQGGYGYGPSSSSGILDPLAGGSAPMSTAVEQQGQQVPFSTADLVEYYARLENGNNLWRRKRRLSLP